MKFLPLFNAYDVALQILDQYKVSYDARTREGAAVSGSLPKSVILVGHSMGGFVARAAVIHPRLRKSAVETVLTLSTPHQYVYFQLLLFLLYFYVLLKCLMGYMYFIQITSRGIAAFIGPLLCTCKFRMDRRI